MTSGFRLKKCKMVSVFTQPDVNTWEVGHRNDLNPCLIKQRRKKVFLDDETTSRYPFLSDDLQCLPCASPVCATFWSLGEFPKAFNSYSAIKVTSFHYLQPGVTSVNAEQGFSQTNVRIVGNSKKMIYFHVVDFSTLQHKASYFSLFFFFLMKPTLLYTLSPRIQKLL